MKQRNCFTSIIRSSVTSTCPTIKRLKPWTTGGRATLMPFQAVGSPQIVSTKWSMIQEFCSDSELLTYSKLRLKMKFLLSFCLLAFQKLSNRHSIYWGLPTHTRSSQTLLSLKMVAQIATTSPWSLQGQNLRLITSGFPKKDVTLFYWVTSLRIAIWLATHVTTTS
jgi:hypothetical protein